MENNFAKNLKIIRETKKISQETLGKKIGVDRSTIGYWENGKADPSMLNVINLADELNIPVTSLIGGDYSSADITDNKNEDIVMIAVYGTIKAGIPIESQEDIIDYIDIPKSWTKGGKQFYGLKISGDSMFPKYLENDIVVFEKTNDTALYNNKDVAIMINGTESTFKKLLINDNGIVLQPYNSAYDIMMFSKEEVETLPIKVVGVAREKRTKVNED